MPLPVSVQFVVAAYSGTAVDVVMSSVEAGNALIVGIAQNSSAIRSYTLTDTVGSKYSEDVHFNPGSGANIFSAVNLDGGTLTVTATYGSTSGSIGISEVRGLNTRALVSDSFVDSSTSSHVCSGVGITTDTTYPYAYVFVVGAISSGGTLTPGSGYTRLDTGSGPLFQERIYASPMVADLGRYTSSINRVATNSMAVYTNIPLGTFGDQQIPIQQRMS